MTSGAPERRRRVSEALYLGNLETLRAYKSTRTYHATNGQLHAFKVFFSFVTQSLTFLGLKMERKKHQKLFKRNLEEITQNANN